MNEINDTTSLVWTVLGIFGGIARIFGKWSETPPESFRAGAFVLALNIFISGFSGFMGATIATQITSNDQLHVIFAGVFGYLGVNGLDYLSNWVKDKFGQPPQQSA